jgi:hypothetical protein
VGEYSWPAHYAEPSARLQHWQGCGGEHGLLLEREIAPAPAGAEVNITFPTKANTHG